MRLTCYPILDSSKMRCKAFCVNGDIIGNVPQYVYEQLENYKEVFTVTSDCVTLNETLNTSTEKTCKINSVLECLRNKNIFCALRGWRNEVSHYNHLSVYINYWVISTIYIHNQEVRRTLCLALVQPHLGYATQV